MHHPAAISPIRSLTRRTLHQTSVNHRQLIQLTRFALTSPSHQSLVKSYPSSPYTPCSVRYQSSMAATRNEYLVIMPDKPGMLQKRFEVRDTHLNSLGPILESGFLKVGGAMFDHHPKEGEVPSMKGSMLMVMAESEQEIRETLAKDIYATSGVWDLDNMQITPVSTYLVHRIPNLEDAMAAESPR